jgi:hypothetical protein
MNFDWGGGGGGGIGPALRSDVGLMCLGELTSTPPPVSSRAHKLDNRQLQSLVAAFEILSHRLAELYTAG